MRPFFITIPHAGEVVPSEAAWLHELPETILMCDTDRYVDRLYQPAISKLGLPSVIAEFHRYVVDLNRWPEDVDCESVQGNQNKSGLHPKGFHWYRTTLGQTIMGKPMPQSIHEKFVKTYFEPFHEQVREKIANFKKNGAKEVFHIDAHSMPSKGGAAHEDPGETRAQVVISDFKGKSCKKWFLDLVVSAYEKAGFQTRINWPYIGGRITQTYGQPEKGQHTIQVEMNRALYMNEQTKAWEAADAKKVQAQLEVALTEIFKNIPENQ